MPEICIILVATAGYPPYAKQLIGSARRHFEPGAHIHFLLFTNQEAAFDEQRSAGCLTTVAIEHEPWPAMTLNRYHMMLRKSDYLSSFDYLMYCDADSLFVGPVYLADFGELTAVLHPGYAGKSRREFPYEGRPVSTACVATGEGTHYFCGGIQGGKPAAYLRAAERIASAMDQDREKGVTATWHDESHWNRYLIDCPPSVILPCSYCWPESWPRHPETKMLALDKNHEAVRRHPYGERIAG